MGKQFLPFYFALTVMVSDHSAFAETDPYFATGEDLDFLIDSSNAFVLEEIEYELRKFILFRKVEDYLFNLSDSFVERED